MTETAEAPVPVAPPQEEGQEAPATAAINANPERMFRYSEYVHVGEGAEDCADNGIGCKNPDHFHAWCRLPNQFQHREIREKALAAQARKSRQLRDTESDAYVILEDEIEDLRDGGDTTAIVEQLVAKEWAEDYLRAVNEVNARDEFKHIIQDQERAQELGKLPPEERDTDESKELEKHLREYSEAVKDALEDLQAPKREAFAGREMDDLLGQVRTQRIEGEGTEEYLHVYGAWEMIVGTYDPEPHPTLIHPHKRKFNNMDDLRAAPPEAVEAVKYVLDGLRVSIQSGSSGNS